MIGCMKKFAGWKGHGRIKILAAVQIPYRINIFSLTNIFDNSDMLRINTTKDRVSVNMRLTGLSDRIDQSLLR